MKNLDFGEVFCHSVDEGLVSFGLSLLVHILLHLVYQAADHFRELGRRFFLIGINTLWWFRGFIFGRITRTFDESLENQFVWISSTVLMFLEGVEQGINPF